jgi:hypothetical protein
MKPKLEVYMIKKVVRADSDLSLSKATAYMDFSCAVCIICSFYAGLLRVSPTIYARHTTASTLNQPSCPAIHISDITALPWQFCL